MEFLFLMVFAIFLAVLLSPNPHIPNDSLVVKRKRCPPHEWFWQTIVDKDGNKVGERMVCRMCGPLKGE